jgi:hypothetical protein
VVVAGACGGGDAPTGADRSEPAASVPDAPSTSGAGPASTPSELLAFSAPAIGGGEVDASIHQGRPVLLWFWSPW